MFRNSSRPVWAFLAIFLAVCFAWIGTAHAQAATRVTACDAATPNNAICVTGTAPTLDTDNKPITQTLSYRVEQRTGTTGGYATVATGLTSIKYYAQNLAPGTYFFRVYANCATNCIESAASNAASLAATPNPVQPQAPVIIIAATIRANGPPIYRIVYTVKPKAGEVVFVAPESMRKLFASK